MMNVLLPRPPSLVSLSMAVLEHDVASVCAVACAALSLVLAMNMSRLRNKAFTCVLGKPGIATQLALPGARRTTPASSVPAQMAPSPVCAKT